MKELQGKTAFITGGAGGLGLSMAKAFGREGMKVMIADIDEGAMSKALAELRDMQIRAEGVQCDVADRERVQSAALKTVETFGKVHVVCNNAGVASAGLLGEASDDDWEWIIDVNLKSVIYGVESFLPLISSHGEGGHFVNTASIAGMIASPPGMEAYCATKHAVVAMTEGWAQQLKPRGIGMSVLCPGFVQTRINESARVRQAKYANVGKASGELKAATDHLVHSGIPVEPVGRRVVEGMKADELYIFTHSEMRKLVEMRFAGIMAGFDSSERSAALKSLPPRDIASLAAPTSGVGRK